MNTIALLPDPSDDDLLRLLGACGLTPPPECGALPAYMRHLNRREDPCQACRDAYLAARAASAESGERKQPIKHGTASGARVHQSRGDKPCAACAAAYNAYQRGRRAARWGHSAA